MSEGITIINGKPSFNHSWHESWMCWVLLHSGLTSTNKDKFDAFLQKYRSGSLSIKIVIDNEIELTDFDGVIRELESQFNDAVNEQAKKIVKDKYESKLNNLVADFQDKVLEALGETW